VSIFDRFINGESVDAVDFTIVDTSSPVQWLAFGAAIGGSIAATVARGLLSIPAAIADAITTLITGLATFLVGEDFASEGIGTVRPRLVDRQPDVVDIVFSGLQDIVTSFWTFNVEQFGILAGPIAVGIVLASLFVLNLTLSEALEQLGGGG
jgi:hypothetical protein